MGETGSLSNTEILFWPHKQKCLIVWCVCVVGFSRKPLSAQASVGPIQRGESNKKSSGSECHVCRDCKSLIDVIIYNSVHTVHCDRPSIHVSLP